MKQLAGYFSRHHIALLALFIALGGTSYAAVSLPKGSVGNPQIKDDAVGPGKVRDGAITRAKVRNNAINSAKVADGTLRAKDFAAGEVPAGPAGPAGPAEGPAGGALTGTYPNPGIAAGAVGPNQIGTIPTMRLIRDATLFPVASGGQGTPVAWPLPTGPRPYDIGGFFDPANNTNGQCVGQGTNTCIIFPRAGTYVLSAGIRWIDPLLSSTTDQDNGTGYRALRIHGTGGRQSGTTTTPALTGTPTIQSLTTVDRFNAGDAAFVSASHNAGTGLELDQSLQQIYFAATWVAP